MAFTSKLDWDTDINAVGGQANVLLVDSPYSDLPSANARQGALTYGNLINEFKPPKIEISPIDNGYYIHSRMHTGDRNAAVDIIGGAAVPAATPAAAAQVAANAPAAAAAAQATAEAGAAPQAVAAAAEAAATGGNVAAAVATAEGAKLTADAPAKEAPAEPKAGQGKEGFRECMSNGVYVAPSRQGYKNTINRTERGAILEDGVNIGADGMQDSESDYETYVEMPEFVGSNIHQEEFSMAEVKSNKPLYITLIILVSIVLLYTIAMCLKRFKPDLLPASVSPYIK